MNFLMISQTGFWLSVVSIAGLLALLQILRSRHRSQIVVTNMFWRQVEVEATARTFWQKFKNLTSYLLALAISLLLFFAFADWQSPTVKNQNSQQIILLDGSAVMTVDDLYETAVDSLLAEINSFSKEQRRVLWVGEQIKPLLIPGENKEILLRRLEGFSPQATPSRIEEQLMHLAKFSTSTATNVVIYGNSPVSADVLSVLPDSMTVLRAYERREIKNNMGISDIGVAPAKSGVWGQVDVYFRIVGDIDSLVTIDKFNIHLNGKPIDQVAVSSGQNKFLISDLVADGATLEISLNTSDSVEVDNRVQMRLPVIKPILVLLSDRLSGSLKDYLEADRAIKLVEDDYDLIIRHANDVELADPSVGQMIFRPMSQESDAFEITTDEQVNDSVLMSMSSALGLDQIDAASMAQATGYAIGLKLKEGDKRQVVMWDELLGDDFNFKKSRAFPLFMAHTIRWLSPLEPWYPYVSAGEELPLNSLGQKGRLLSEDGSPFETLGSSQIPLTAGVVSTQKGDLSASLQGQLNDNGSKNLEIDSLSVREKISANLAIQSHLMTWILLLAIALIIFEWRLNQTGRMP